MKRVHVNTLCTQIGGPEGLALAHLQWEKMQPGMERLDRLEELVAKVREDMDKLEVQLEQAEATVDGGGGTLKQVNIPSYS